MSDTLLGQSVRLRYLEAVLFTEGRANSSTLTALGLSRQQATADIGRYLDIAGPVMAYKPSAKFFIVDRRRKPAFLSREEMPGFIAAVELILKTASPGR